MDSTGISSLWAMNSFVDMSKINILSILQYVASLLRSLHVYVVQGSIFWTTLLNASKTDESKIEVKLILTTLLLTPSSDNFFLCFIKNSSLASWVVS